MPEEKREPFSVVNARGQKYYLHSRLIELRSHHLQQIYFFVKTQKEGVMYEIPKGFEVVENTRTGLPCLRRKK